MSDILIVNEELQDALFNFSKTCELEGIGLQNKIMACEISLSLYRAFPEHNFGWVEGPERQYVIKDPVRFGKFWKHSAPVSFLIKRGEVISLRQFDFLMKNIIHNLPHTEAPSFKGGVSL